MNKLFVFMLFIAFTAIRAEEIVKSASINSNLINVVAIGYDIDNNPRAQQMLENIGQAARDAGAIGEVIMAKESEAELEQALQKAMSIAIARETPTATKTYKLELKTESVAPGEKVIVVHSDFPQEDANAWIAFYKNENDRDEDYISYTFLLNLTDRIYDVIAPKEPGNEYHFRLFTAEGYDCVARSANVAVK